MRDTATNSMRSRRRAGRARLGWICGAFVVLQIAVVTLTPPRLREITAGLLTTVTIVAVVVVAREVGFKRRAAARGAGLPRRPREGASPLVQRAYHLARSGAPASRIATSCDVPEAFAVLIIDDVRRAASRRGRAARNSSGRPHSAGRRPKNPPAI